MQLPASALVASYHPAAEFLDLGNCLVFFRFSDGVSVLLLDPVDGLSL
jgi:hypothetical protein